MDISDILFILLFLFPHLYALALGECPASMCGNTGFPIRFPFGLQGYQPKNCSYPGFDLTCNTQGTTVISLPNSGEFFVRAIDYVTQEIKLYEPSGCLPRRLLTLDLKGSPFVASFYQNYTFLSCPASFTKSKFAPIDCLSNSTTSVMATPSTSLANSMSATCKIIATMPVPVSGIVRTEDGFSVNFDSDLSLTWYEPGCSPCEGQGGTCGFESNTSQVLGCFYNSTGRSSNGFQVFKIICVSIVVPTLTMAVGIACFACLKDRSLDRTAHRNPAVAALPEQESTIVIHGLDQTTIESYQKLVLGESRRLPGPNDTTCAICLSEYLIKDTVRCIPECKHCFHAECVDEWLKLNSTCPVCRNNPSPAHVDSNGV
ncbi:PREDICTED: putative RING-H2 finger protein ATL21A [Fragaria vesca subsp. vesca]|uniref:putative RING-H2 finger protein ATL21A n=1 Tax=Fragaria vesca subsp. vesca TaxID=101020 RepID=UPI0002C2F6CE|nr:PREDICTED: putative RING-H2 finger protein ATL21A [Fragaria vesca subsp. vesca]